MNVTFGKAFINGRINYQMRVKFKKGCTDKNKIKQNNRNKGKKNQNKF